MLHLVSMHSSPPQSQRKTTVSSIQLQLLVKTRNINKQKIKLGEDKFNYQFPKIKKESFNKFNILRKMLFWSSFCGIFLQFCHISCKHLIQPKIYENSVSSYYKFTVKCYHEMRKKGMKEN